MFHSDRLYPAISQDLQIGAKRSLGKWLFEYTPLFTFNNRKQQIFWIWDILELRLENWFFYFLNQLEIS